MKLVLWANRNAIGDRPLERNFVIHPHHFVVWSRKDWWMTSSTKIDHRAGCGGPMKKPGVLRANGNAIGDRPLERNFGIHPHHLAVWSMKDW